MNYRAAMAAITMVIALVAIAEAQVKQQSAEAAPVAFEVAAVKPQQPAPISARGCDGGFPKIEGNRFIVTTTPYALITWAYGYNKTWGCSYVNFGDLLTGEPEWIRAERYEIQALIPEGTPVPSVDAFMKGDAPQVERMLQSLLADRFKLVAHRVTKDVQAYALLPGKGGPKLTRSTSEDKPTMAMLRQAGQNGQMSNKVVARKAEMRDLAFLLLRAVRRPVIDRTGLTGEFNFDFEFAPPDSDTFAESSGPSLFTALQESLGLRLETVKAPLDGLVIERAERPSEN